MADNVSVTPGSGRTIRTVQIAGIDYQVVKLCVGGESAEILVDAANPMPTSDVNTVTLGAQTTANSPAVNIASDQTVPVWTGYGAAVALSSPASALTASTDTTYTFASPIHHLHIQNNSSTATGFELGAVAATAGSEQLPGSNNNLFVAHFATAITVVHFYSTAATNVNGSSGSNIVLKGWS